MKSSCEAPSSIWPSSFMLRFTPRREVGSFSTTNLIVIVIIADAAQNALAGDYRSISDGLLLVAVIIGWSIVLDAAALRGQAGRPRSVLAERSRQQIYLR